VSTGRWTAIVIAAARGHDSAIVEMLLGAAPAPNPAQVRMALEQAALSGSASDVRLLHKAAGMCVDSPEMGWGDAGRTLLMGVARQPERAEVVRMLVLELGAAVDRADFAGKTALMYAAGTGRADAVAALWAAGAAVNRQMQGAGVTAHELFGHATPRFPSFQFFIASMPPRECDSPDRARSTIASSSASEGRENLYFPCRWSQLLIAL
jgi:hypothetical protein